MKKSSPWWSHAVIYQIYPWSFRDSDGNGFGDLRGVIEKLDYLNDGTANSLGVDAIWLSPIFRSPMVDHGYDIADYRNIDPLFGSLASCDELLREAHRRNIRVLFDFVPNHTSDQHPWFVASRSSRENAQRDWYIWRDPKPDGSPPNNWVSVFGGSAWTYDAATNQCYLHTFLSEQPDLNWFNNAVQREMLDTLRFWLDRGVDGFRVDAIEHLMKDARFRDDPPNPAYSPNTDPYFLVQHVFSEQHGDPWPLRLMCNAVEPYGDRCLFTEEYVDIEKLRPYYEVSSKNLVIPFNFNLIAVNDARPNIPWAASAYRAFVDAYERSLRPGDVPNYVIGNHDRHRVATRLGHHRARLAAMLQLTLRGAAFIYYGEELGMEDVPIPDDLQRDPLAQRVRGLRLGRDPERTPMQWSTEAHAGFSHSTPWLPIHEKYTDANVERESTDPSSMLSFYRSLIHLRKALPSLREGAYRSLDAGDSDIFAFLRKTQNDRSLILLNFSDEPRTANISGSQGRIRLSTSRKPQDASLIPLDAVTLGSFEGLLLTDVTRPDLK